MGDSGEELSFRALTSVREVVEEDAWRTSRQTLASKQHKLHRGSFHHRSLLEEASLNQRAPPNEGKGVEIRDFVGYGSKPPTPVPQVGSLLLFSDIRGYGSIQHQCNDD